MQYPVQKIARVSRHSGIHPRLLFTRKDDRRPLLTRTGISLYFARWPLYPDFTARCALLPLRERCGRYWY